MIYEINGPIVRIDPAPRKLAKLLPGLTAGDLGVVITPEKNSEADALISLHHAVIRYTLMRAGYVIDTPKGYYEERGISVDLTARRRPAVNAEDIFLSAATILDADATLALEADNVLGPLDTILIRSSNLEGSLFAEAGVVVAEFVLQGSGIYEPANGPVTIATHGEQLLEGKIATI